MEIIVYVTLVVSSGLFFVSGVSLMKGDVAFLPKSWFAGDDKKSLLMCRVIGALTLFMAVSFIGGAIAGIFGASDEIVSALLVAAIVSVVWYEGFGFCVKYLK
ncbi:MAG: hypothetical protein FWB96_09625 [Defluviitaleaceae bacterium]|nr:hypothetical protein [Defluviitaleaceae bacterium]MCL2263126.1 hypothetical protein [Defluviitaleaceae bacterium]